MGEDTRWWPMREMTADERRFFTESVRPLGEVVGTYDDASRVDPALSVDPSRSNPVDTNTLATPAPSPVSGEPECKLCGQLHPPAIGIQWLCECGECCHAKVASLLSDRERLTRELDEMRADAERWRWIRPMLQLRTNPESSYWPVGTYLEAPDLCEFSSCAGVYPTADALIDQARRLDPDPTSRLPSTPSDRE